MIDCACPPLDTTPYLTLTFAKAEEREAGALGRRFPTLTPVPTPSGKPQPPAFMRPAVPAYGVMDFGTQVFSLPAQKIKLKLGGALPAKTTGNGAAPSDSAAPARSGDTTATGV